MILPIWQALHEMIAKGCSLRNSDLPAAYEGEADITHTLAIVAIYEYVPSTKTQNEENRAVMGRELLWAMCGFQQRGRGHPVGGRMRE